MVSQKRSAMDYPLRAVVSRREDEKHGYVDVLECGHELASPRVYEGEGVYRLLSYARRRCTRCEPRLA
jgi:hypothetical protein